MSDQLLNAANNYVDLFEQALKKGLKFQVADWDFDRVLSEIKKGNPCIIYLHVTDTITHVVLAHGIKGNRLKIMDPLRNIKYVSKEELNKSIVNPMGRIVSNWILDKKFNKLLQHLSLRSSGCFSFTKF
jgi:ABC-type bacteriocin/lantibiotic exporter with double-glycine peptidase domain